LLIVIKVVAKMILVFGVIILIHAVAKKVDFVWGSSLKPFYADIIEDFALEALFG
jgi:hypothetical protein